jgi:hypothetical protein
MPNPKQMEKLARAAALSDRSRDLDPGPGDLMPEQLWDALLADPRTAASPAQPVRGKFERMAWYSWVSSNHRASISLTFFCTPHRAAMARTRVA